MTLEDKVKVYAILMFFMVIAIIGAFKLFGATLLAWS